MNEPTSADEMRRIGEEMQRGIPTPSRRVPRWLHQPSGNSERRETTGATIDTLVDYGLVGLLVALPGIVLAIVRARRRPQHLAR